MTEKQMLIFMTVANTGSFSDAAELLSISEPAVSKSIKALENEFGCEFFVRGKGKKILTFTDKGEIFLDIVKRWQYLIDDAKGLSDPGKETFRMTATSSISQVFLPGICRKLYTSHPSLNLSIDSHHTRSSTELVSNNHYDLAFCSFIIPNQKVIGKALFKEELVIICSEEMAKKYPDPRKKVLEKRMFISWDTDSFVWEHFESGSADGLTLTSNTVDGIEYYLTEMDMWTLVPISYAKYISRIFGFSVIPMKEHVQYRTTYSLQAAHNSNPLIEEAIEIMRDEAKKYDGIELI